MFEFALWQIWLIFAGIFFIAEIFTVGFLIFWLSVGSLLAMITSFFTSNIVIQMAVFVVSSTILIFATKPFTQKFSKKDNILTNVYTLVGKKAKVIEDINSTEGKGQIKNYQKNLFLVFSTLFLLELFYLYY